MIERACTLPSPDAALSPRRATYFSLLRQRNLRKRKATLCLRPLRFAAGQPAVLGPAGVSCKLALLKQARALIRLAFRSSAHTEGSGVRIQIRGALTTLRALNGAASFIAACARIHWASGLNASETAFSNSRCINAVATQIKRQTSSGFAELFSL